MPNEHSTRNRSIVPHGEKAKKNKKRRNERKEPLALSRTVLYYTVYSCRRGERFENRGATGMSTEDKTAGFELTATGQVESGDFGGVDSLYCKCSYLIGKDWRIIRVRRGRACAVAGRFSVRPCARADLSPRRAGAGLSRFLAPLSPPSPHCSSPSSLIRPLRSRGCDGLAYMLARNVTDSRHPTSPPLSITPHCLTSSTNTQGVDTGILKLHAKTMPASPLWCGTFR